MAMVMLMTSWQPVRAPDQTGRTRCSLPSPSGWKVRRRPPSLVCFRPCWSLPLALCMCWTLPHMLTQLQWASLKSEHKHLHIQYSQPHLSNHLCRLYSVSKVCKVHKVCKEKTVQHGMAFLVLKEKERHLPTRIPANGGDGVVVAVVVAVVMMIRSHASQRVF